MILIILLFLVAIYFYSTRSFKYWAKRNVKHDHPIPLFGNHFENVFGIKSITEISMELYNKYPHEKIVGYFRGTTPELVIRDIEIAKNILTTDFAYFYSRGISRDIKKEPLVRNLFFADGDLWKLLRQRITPAFTAAKLKGMFPLIMNCAKKLQVIGETICNNGGECDVRELMARYTTEFIGAVGFGIEVDTIHNENSNFRELGKRIFAREFKTVVLFGLWEIFPEIRKMLVPVNTGLYDAISTIVKSICEQRNFKPSGRGDFIDLLLELKCKGAMKGESIEKKNPDGSPVTVEIEMDFPCLVAQVFVFFAAGFETSSFSTSFTLHQLAHNPEIQRKIQNEIDIVLLKYNNELCYESISDMTILTNAFNEAMRMLPSVGTILRECTKRYTIPDLNISLDPGVKIMIPVQAIQNDELYFDNPTEFRPDRFADSKTERKTYLPFGAGPRACIGARLGEIQSLAGLTAILHKFSVEPSPNTVRYPKINSVANLVQGIKQGLPLKLTLRKNIL